MAAKSKSPSDTFDEHHAKLVAGQGDHAGANPADQDEPGGTAARRIANPKCEGRTQTARPIRHSSFDISPRPTTRRLAIMNLALRGIEAGFGPENADTFHPDLRAADVRANPPFNDSDTALRDSAFLHTGGKLRVMTERQHNFRKDDDVRWQPGGARQIAKGNPQGERGGVHQFGVTPKGNANFAWVQHFIHHLAPQRMAGFALANGSMSSNQSGERNFGSASWMKTGSLSHRATP